MLREGLRAEVPGLFDLAAHPRRPAIPEMSPVLAAFGALGVQELVVACIYTVQAAGLFVTGAYRLPPGGGDWLIVASYALGTVFAFAAARWRGVLVAVAVIVAIWAVEFVLNLPGRQTFCDRSGTPCDLVTIVWPQAWPRLLGIAVGVVAARAVRQGGPGLSGLALGLGVFALSFPIGRMAFVPFLGPNPVGGAAEGAVHTIIAVHLVGALACGVVVGAIGHRRILDAAVLIVYFLGPWSPQLRSFIRDTPRPFILAIDWQLFTPVGYALAAVLGVVLGMIAARYRATRTPTIP